MNNKQVTWIVSLVLLLVLGWFFRDQLQFIGQGLSHLKDADPAAVLAVLAFSLGSIAAMSDVTRRLTGAGNVNVSLREAYALTLAANSWSTTLPAGPAFSAILMFKVQATWGASVALRSYFFFLSSIISTVSLAIIGLAGVFFLNADMALGSLLTTVVLMLVAAGAVFWVTSHPDELSRWIRRQKIIPGAERIIPEIQALKEVHLSRRNFALVSAASFGHRILDMLALWACVWAVTGEIPWLRAGENATTMAGVALAFLAAKIAGSAQVTPGGLGTVEAALIAPLVATGMTAVDATSAAVIYRLISFALVTVIGWIIYFFHYARRGLSYRALNRKD
ncbi:membrane protein [Corynebacterium phocae]|uniref:Membrane protein n=1 Tax=Corynebacterium phocae TaxID=161895 RepID=A0A1L7D5H3_9CORY|nr:YbhN family protein [Corynebacterium phocae]APT93388.1 membrane protein [Corynebacterium phocae]KAA8721730.1 UPF0104 family protein [Corynebacterium phocae]